VCHYYPSRQLSSSCPLWTRCPVGARAEEAIELQLDMHQYRWVLLDGHMTELWPPLDPGRLNYYYGNFAGISRGLSSRDGQCCGRRESDRERKRARESGNKKKKTTQENSKFSSHKKTPSFLHIRKPQVFFARRLRWIPLLWVDDHLTQIL
jgi:hypothetical protein